MLQRQLLLTKGIWVLMLAVVTRMKMCIQNSISSYLDGVRKEKERLTAAQIIIPSAATTWYQDVEISERIGIWTQHPGNSRAIVG